MKRIYFLGSSITEGYLTNGISFCDIIKKDKRALVYKDAISGTTLSTKKENSYFERLNKNINNFKDYNYFVIQLSTNDSNKENNIEIGNCEDTNPETTFGAINNIIDLIKEKTKAKIIFFTSLCFDNPIYEDMILKLNTLRKRKKFLILDFYHDKYFKENVNQFLGDTIHPNMDGYIKMSEYFKDALNFRRRIITLENKHFKMHTTYFVYVALVMIIASFLGWIAENIVRAISLGVIDNRYQFLPFIAPYGLAVFAMYLALGTPNNFRFFGYKVFKVETINTKLISHIAYFLTTAVFVFAGELAIGWFYEATTGLHLWDYSNIPLHFTKYTGLIPALGYGFGAYALMAFLFTPLIKIFEKSVSYNVAFWITVTLGVIIVLDNINMIIITLVNKEKPIYWQLFLPNYHE